MILILAELLESIPHIADDYFKDIPRKPYEGTYDKVIKDVYAWRRDNKPIFWLHGRPQSGKTTALGAALEYIRTKEKSDLIAEFRCTRLAPLYTDPHMIIPMLSWKLQKADEEYRRQLVSVLSRRYRKEDRTTQKIQSWPSRQQLKDLLVDPFASILEAYRTSNDRKVILVIDSLEECLYNDWNSNTDLVGQLLRELLAIAKDGSLPGLKVIISSVSGETSQEARQIMYRLTDSGIAVSVTSYSMTDYPEAAEEMEDFYEKRLGGLKSSQGAIRKWLDKNPNALHDLSKVTKGNFFLANLVCSQVLQEEEWSIAMELLQLLPIGSGRDSDPYEKLEQVLQRGSLHKSLEKHYQRLLDTATSGCSAEDVQLFWNALYTIVLLQSLMSVENLAKIVGYEYPKKLQSILLGKRALEPLVFIPTDDPLRPLDVIRVHDTIFLDYVRTGRIFQDEERVDQSVLQCDLAVKLLMLLNSWLEASPSWNTKDPLPKHIEYASCFWWRHLQQSYDTISPISTPENENRLIKSQCSILKHLIDLLKQNSDKWFNLLEQSPGTPSPVVALNVIKTFLLIVQDRSNQGKYDTEYHERSMFNNATWPFVRDSADYDEFREIYKDYYGKVQVLVSEILQAKEKEEEEKQKEREEQERAKKEKEQREKEEQEKREQEKREQEKREQEKVVMKWLKVPFSKLSYIYFNCIY
ncbi:hypothetical protein VKT23_017472 [Stygiomarasmius scandens]|uniref:Nephrocystin 3-like N-terminal domain-containing protein n=1 Tax=Marasmiellus scandens TaxID=2682957 RepID=A0ABR1IUW4_9AGAR